MSPPDYATQVLIRPEKPVRAPFMFVKGMSCHSVKVTIMRSKV